MSDVPVVKFENVSKRFVFSPETPQSIQEMMISVFSRRQRESRNRDLWAVRDVNFEVKPGRALGIIGRNGSGKSTILKLITRILRPTKGRMMINGRISALLELGAGFHHDLTGRENIYLNASVLGLDKATIHERFQDIVDFSELGQFINMPVKHYSSGMYMRLGFSVAVHVHPEILIVDEILAVGDKSFQTKCIDRIFEMKSQGVTIIMVSHNLAMMRNLCTDMIWLENGRVLLSGSADDVSEQYLAHTYKQESQQLSDQDASQPFKRAGSGEIKITAVRFLTSDGQETNNFKTNDPLTIEIDYASLKPIRDPEFGVAFFRQDGILISGPNNLASGFKTGNVDGNGTICYHVDRLPLLPARYQITTAIYGNQFTQIYDHHDKAYSIRVIPRSADEISGFVDLPATWAWR